MHILDLFSNVKSNLSIFRHVIFIEFNNEYRVIANVQIGKLVRLLTLPIKFYKTAHLTYHPTLPSQSIVSKKRNPFYNDASRAH